MTIESKDLAAALAGIMNDNADILDIEPSAQILEVQENVIAVTDDNGRYFFITVEEA